MEQFKLMFECEDCKEKFPVTQDQAPNSLTHKKEFISNGQSIFLTYYDCPHCGKRHFVQIDDDYSLAMLDSVKKTFVKFTYRRKKGKRISKKENSKFVEARADLGKYRMNLMKTYSGKVAYDKENLTQCVLRFSV